MKKITIKQDETKKNKHQNKIIMLLSCCFSYWSSHINKSVMILIGSQYWKMQRSKHFPMISHEIYFDFYDSNSINQSITSESIEIESINFKYRRHILIKIDWFYSLYWPKVPPSYAQKIKMKMKTFNK